MLRGFTGYTFEGVKGKGLRVRVGYGVMCHGLPLKGEG